MRTWYLLALLLLSACVPQNSNPQPPSSTTPKVEGAVAFYPAQPGLEWVYQPAGSIAGDPPYKLSITGQAPFAGQVAYRYRFFGRGQDRVYYRQIDAAGVRLLGFEEVVTNTVTRFDPPIQEYPAAGNLTVGARWGGTTRYAVDLLAGGRTTRFSEGSFEYTYTVAGRTTVSVFNSSYEVLRVALERKTGQAIERFELWFVPNIGEVRTQEGLQLVERNFK